MKTDTEVFMQSHDSVSFDRKCSHYRFPAFVYLTIISPGFCWACPRAFSPSLMTSEAELHHISSGLLLCLSLTQISRHCSLCRSCLVVTTFPKATLSRRFPLKSACQRPATPSHFDRVNPQRLFIAHRSIRSFMESNFSDGEAKCSNFAARKKKEKRSATSNVFSSSFKLWWKRWKCSVYQSNRYSHSS